MTVIEHADAEPKNKKNLAIRSGMPGLSGLLLPLFPPSKKVAHLSVGNTRTIKKQLNPFLT
jgi:hypothetical protein